MENIFSTMYFVRGYRLLQRWPGYKYRTSLSFISSNMFLLTVSNLCKVYHEILPFFKWISMLCTFFIKTDSWKNVTKTSVKECLFIKTSGKSSGILLNITLHKKCFLALFSYNNDSIISTRNQNVVYILKWAYTGKHIKWMLT